MLIAVVSQKSKVIMRRQYVGETPDNVVRNINRYIKEECLNEDGICSVTVGVKVAGDWEYERV